MTIEVTPDQGLRLAALEEAVKVHGTDRHEVGKTAQEFYDFLTSGTTAREQKALTFHTRDDHPDEDKCQTCGSEWPCDTAMALAGIS